MPPPAGRHADPFSMVGNPLPTTSEDGIPRDPNSSSCSRARLGHSPRRGPVRLRSYVYVPQRSRIRSDEHGFNVKVFMERMDAELASPAAHFSAAKRHCRIHFLVCVHHTMQV